MALALKDYEAVALHKAVCDLAQANVSLGTVSMRNVSVAFRPDGTVTVHQGTIRQEDYLDRNGFAKAYGLRAFPVAGSNAATEPLNDCDRYWVAFPATQDVLSARWGLEPPVDRQRLAEGRVFYTERAAWAVAKPEA